MVADRQIWQSAEQMMDRYGDDALIDKGALAYAEAKAEVDGMIAGLVVAIAQEKNQRKRPWHAFYHGPWAAISEWGLLK